MSNNGDDKVIVKVVVEAEHGLLNEIVEYEIGQFTIPAAKFKGLVPFVVSISWIAIISPVLMLMVGLI